MAKPVKHYDKWRIRVIDNSGKRLSAVFGTYREAEQWGKLREAELVRERLMLGLPAPTAPTTPTAPTPTAPTTPVALAPPAAPTAPVGAALETVPAVVVPEKTFSELADFWLEHRAPGKITEKDDQSMIRRHLRPAFGPLRLSQLTTEVAIVHSGEHAGGPKTLGNRLTLLTTMLTLAVDLGWLARVPKILKPKVRVCDSGYRWLRTRAEVDRVLAAARVESEQVYVLYATAIWTGMRQGEVAALRWTDLDFDRRLIGVERAWKRRPKGGRSRHVPLFDTLLPVLLAWRLRSPGELVFENERGTMHNNSARIFEETLHRVLKRAGFPHERKRGELKPYVTFHDLRHTFASHFVLGGGDVFRLQKILGHASIEMTMRYAHLAPDAYTNDRGRLGEALSPF